MNRLKYTSAYRPLAVSGKFCTTPCTNIFFGAQENLPEKVFSVGEIIVPKL